MKSVTDLLTKGLCEGYAGKTIIETVDRGGFVLKKSRFFVHGFEICKVST